MANKDFAAEIGRRISDRRKQLGLTQEQAAEKADLTQQFFASVESGSKNIRAESIIKVCYALDLSTDFLLKGVTTDLDRSRIVKLLERLDPPQQMEMEQIILQILKFSGYSD